MKVSYNFEWDPRKAQDNREKHGVAFDEAATVFADLKALSIFDPEHSESEDRWITMGISEKGRLLMVIHTFREEREILSRSELFQVGKQQNKKPQHTGNEHEKRV